MGALKWGLRPLSAILRTIVLKLCTLVALLGPFLKGTVVANDDNRRQSWTIVHKYLKPPFSKPHLDFPKKELTEFCGKVGVFCRKTR